MLSQQEISDQIEITQVLNRYFRSMDTKDYDLLASVFTQDAVVFYDTLDGTKTTYEAMIPLFERFNESFFFTQHVASQIAIDVDGDIAESSSSLRAVHVQETHEGEHNKWVMYGIYRDKFVRTETGWRIAARYFKGCHSEGALLPPDRVKRFPVPRHLEKQPPKPSTR